MHYDNNIILTILSASNPSTLMNPLGLSYMVTWLETRGAVYMVIYNHHVSPVSWKRTCKRDGRPNNQNTSRTIRMPTTPDNTLTIQDITTLWWNFKRRTWWPKTERQVTALINNFTKWCQAWSYMSLQSLSMKQWPHTNFRIQWWLFSRLTIEHCPHSHSSRNKFISMTM